MSEMSVSPTTEKAKIEYSITVTLADDYYTAYLTMRFQTFNYEDTPENDNYKEQLKKEVRLEIDERLKRLNINYGIQYDAIDAVAKNLTDVEALPIAIGVPHINAIDAMITYLVNFEGKAKPVVLEDGSVDFKNLLQASSVTKDMCLASRTSVIPGADGLTVTGKPIKHRQGKEAPWKYGENVYETQDGTMLMAKDEGIAKLINGRVTVLRLIEVDEVGPESGNVFFGGDVHVKKNVLDGYTIHCDGDLTIDGVVEGCTIKAKGNLTVAKGILGHGTSDIIVGGNLVSKFIENATVYVKGEIETGEIINSKVLCDSKITVKGKKGLIIGGEITSKYMIEANHIGSRLGVLTSINLGVDASVIQELKHLKEEVQELKIQESRLIARIPVLKENKLKQPEVGIHDDVLHEHEDLLLATQVAIEEKSQRLAQLMDALKLVNQGKVKINSIFPDTVVRIGNSKYFVDKALSACIITRADDQVIAIGVKED